MIRPTGATARRQGSALSGNTKVHIHPPIEPMLAKSVDRPPAQRAARWRYEPKDPITFSTVAHQAHVSRAWLYAETEIRAAIQKLRDDTRRGTHTTPVPAAQRASSESLLRRLETAHSRNRELTAEINALRDQLAHAHGELRAARRRGYDTAHTRPDELADGCTLARS